MKNTSTNPRPQNPEHTQAALEPEAAGLLLGHMLTLCYLQRHSSGTLHRFCLCSENNLQGKEHTSLRILRCPRGEGGQVTLRARNRRPLPRQAFRHADRASTGRALGGHTSSTRVVLTPGVSWERRRRRPARPAPASHLHGHTPLTV